MAEIDDTKRAYASEKNERIYNFLQEQPVGVLATVDPNGNPHAAAIYFGVDEDFNIRFTTKRDTKKHDNLMHANHVMLVSYEPVSQSTVQVSGIAEEITDDNEANEAFQSMLNAARKVSDSDMPPISKLQAGHYVAFRIKPVQIRMAIFTRPDSGGYDMFETIDLEP